MIDGLEHRAEIAEPISSRRKFIRTAAVTGGAGLLLEGLVPMRAQESGEKTPLLVLPAATKDLLPFTVHVPQGALDDLKKRIANTRWPNKEPVTDWSQGVPLVKAQALVDYWRTRYDWRRVESTLNGLPQFRTQIDGLGIYFIHVRSKHENALPMILTHGWPGSIIEFLQVIGPLTDPTAHGGKAKDAFHVVIPSLPGFGFSDKPTAPGWGLPRIANAWAVLMARLGYNLYVAQGGDWGAGVTSWMAKQHVSGLAAIHLNLPILFRLRHHRPAAIQMQNSRRLLNSASMGATEPLTVRFREPALKHSGTVLPTRRLGKQCGYTKNFRLGATTKVIPWRRSRSIICWMT